MIRLLTLRDTDVDFTKPDDLLSYKLDFPCKLSRIQDCDRFITQPENDRDNSSNMNLKMSKVV